VRSCAARPQVTVDPTDIAVDRAVLTEMKPQRIPGLALGVYRDGQIVRAQGYGLATVELNVPVKPETSSNQVLWVNNLSRWQS
jgi:CubicO group peptidase (beta-lactamase class C family)